MHPQFMYATEPSVPMAAFHLRATLCGTVSGGMLLASGAVCQELSEFNSVGTLRPASGRRLERTSSVAMEAGGLHRIKTSFLPALTTEGKVLQRGVNT